MSSHDLVGPAGHHLGFRAFGARPAESNSDRSPRDPLLLWTGIRFHMCTGNCSDGQAEVPLSNINPAEKLQLLLPMPAR